MTTEDIIYWAVLGAVVGIPVIIWMSTSMRSSRDQKKSDAALWESRIKK